MAWLCSGTCVWLRECVWLCVWMCVVVCACGEEGLGAEWSVWAVEWLEWMVWWMGCAVRVRVCVRVCVSVRACVCVVDGMVVRLGGVRVDGWTDGWVEGRKARE